MLLEGLALLLAALANRVVSLYARRDRNGQTTGLICDRGQAEELDQGDLVAKGGVKFRVQLEQQERMATQVEEIVGQSNLGQAQDL